MALSFYLPTFKYIAKFLAIIFVILTRFFCFVILTILISLCFSSRGHDDRYKLFHLVLLFDLDDLFALLDEELFQV
jgi:hypothetical protein